MFFVSIFLLELVILLHHIHLLFFKCFHDEMGFLAEELDEGLAGGFFNQSYLQIMCFFHSL